MSEHRPLPVTLTLLMLFSGSLLCTMAAATELDDPMRPSTSRPQPAPETRTQAPKPPPAPTTFVPEQHTLQQIYVLGQIRRARINNTWYEPGDRILNGKVVDVLPHAAVVEAGDLYHMLYLNRERTLFRSLKEAE